MLKSDWFLSDICTLSVVFPLIDYSLQYSSNVDIFVLQFCFPPVTDLSGTLSITSSAADFYVPLKLNQVKRR